MEGYTMEQIQRIVQMENYLNEAQEVVSACAEVLEQLEPIRKQYEACLPKIAELSKYYGSAEWFADKEDSDNGKLPENLRCGVLSEDAVYNLLADYDMLVKQMEELGKTIIKSR